VARLVKEGRFYTLERDPSDSDFSVVGLSYSDSEAVITLAGELDLAGVPVLQACLLEAAAGGADTIEVGFARVTYVDSSGLGILVSAHKRLQSRGGILVISQPSERVMRVLTISGLSRYLNIRRQLRATGADWSG
jgi:anti-sigma B factor antagonist